MWMMGINFDRYSLTFNGCEFFDRNENKVYIHVLEITFLKNAWRYMNCSVSCQHTFHEALTCVLKYAVINVSQFMTSCIFENEICFLTKCDGIGETGPRTLSCWLQVFSFLSFVCFDQKSCHFIPPSVDLSILPSSHLSFNEFPVLDAQTINI